MPASISFPLDFSQNAESVPAVVQLLDENTANRIAAGEVIERPFSVVKELVENALDAGATRIDVEIVNGGKNKIVVRDNGGGMARHDAVLALQRHATSKIRTSDDLFAIHTLGFRGEALPSIASVSDFTLLTKRDADETATEIIARGGDLVSVGDAAGVSGTTITVENLFWNTPARLKFLKSTPTEVSHAADLMHRFILAYPAIAFRLVHDNHEMVAFPGAANHQHALACVWGRDVARDMVPFDYESPHLSVSGWVSKPSVTRATRSSQATFVNGRFVRSRTVQHAFDSAFKNLMTTDRHPVMVLFVRIDPALVDVNVHPAKTEVRFTRDGDVYGAVHRAVENALMTGGLVPEVRVTASLPLMEPIKNAPPRAALSSWGSDVVDLSPVAAEAPSPAAGEESKKEADASGNAASFLLPSPAAGDERSELLGEGDSPEGWGMGEAEAAASYIGFDGQRIGRLRVLGQSRNTYIVAETEDALLLIDQHIAHERVLYEQMMNGHTQKAASWGVIAQHLALPQTLVLGKSEARVASERLEALQKAGFVLEPFGGETFVVRAVPATLAQKDYLGVLREIIDEMAGASIARRLLVPHESALIMASCKMAVKKNDPLTMAEMTRLLSDLAQMQNPFTCPHGRPILLSLPHREMDRKFHRIGPH